MAIVDSLEIQIAAQSTTAAKSLDNLIGKLDRLSSSLTRASGTGLSTLAMGVSRLSTAMINMKSVNAADFTRLAKNMEKIAAVDNGKIRAVAVSFSGLTRSLSGLSGIGVSDSASKIADLAKGISQLGYKSASQAIKNIPLLATAMEDLIRKMSALPKVSKNLINFTNALAKLSRTGGASGTAAKSLTKSMTGYSSGITRATKHTYSFASALGKLYATYWLVFRVFSKLGDAIDLSSSLTEVQNVVDVTFGKYSDMVEKMSQTSIQDFGMSELTVKQVSSRFQAMGTAMGFAQGRMAEMSVDLTALAADMASFYNVEQEAVAEDLESIFTGQTRPLRQYGLDLTEATLKEWAMKQGLDANISSMSQAEKAMLRYQYVMANTGAAQGDFLRTADTWANQTRILKQNIEQLGVVVGGTFINAFKPLVKTLNVVIGKFTQLAMAISNSLGKIFGWTYEDTTGGLVSEEYEDAATYADDLASGTGNAADNAKKLKSYLLGIDELNVLSPDDTTSTGGSGGSGGGVSGGTATDATGGVWSKTDSILKAYESELDSLEKLGNYISTKIANTLIGIDWNSVYENASNFGTGFAEFLNGLINPRLFGSVGTTIANSLNTAIYSALSFGETFDFEGFGESIATGINVFFNNFDFVSLGKTLNLWVDGLESTIAGFLNTLKWEDILNGIGDFLGELELDTIVLIAPSILFKLGKAVTANSILNSIISEIASVTGITSFLSAISNVGGALTLFVTAGMAIDYSFISATKREGQTTEEAIVEREERINATTYVDSQSFIDTFTLIKTKWEEVFGTPEENEKRISSTDYVDSEDFTNTFTLIKTKWEEFKKWWNKNNVLKKISTTYEDFKAKIEEKWGDVVEYWEDKDILSEVKTTYENIKSKVKEKWEETISYWNYKDALSEVRTTYENIKQKLSDKWNEALNYWKDKGILSEVKTTYENFKQKISDKWNDVLEYWKTKTTLSEVKTTYEDIKSKISELWNDALTWWKNNAKLPKLDLDFDISFTSVKNALNNLIHQININIIDKLNNLRIEIPQGLADFLNLKTNVIGFNIPRIPRFEDGGFPEPASLFWAGENGVPEMLGTVGGRTAVASGNEITGIRQEIRDTANEEIILLREQIALLRELISKDFGVYIGDKEIARANNRGQRALGRQLITEI